MAEIRCFREALKMEKVRGRTPDAAGRQKRGAVEGAGTMVKKWSRAVTGQRADPGMLGIGIRSNPCLCWRVLVQRIRRTAPDVVNLMSRRERWRLGSNRPQEATVRLDFLRKEKKAVQNKAQMAA